MIKTTLIGHIGKDCVVKEVSGKNVINFSVAHTEKYKNHEGTQMERTTWVECAYWSEKTAVAQYLTKGKLIYVEGTPSSDYYSKDGKVFSTLRLRVASIQLLGGAESTAPRQSAVQSNNEAPTAREVQSSYGNSASSDINGTDTVDDLPF